MPSDMLVRYDQLRAKGSAHFAACRTIGREVELDAETVWRTVNRAMHADGRRTPPTLTRPQKEIRHAA